MIRYHRHSIRLLGFDYSTPSWYYITICTHHKKLFGEVKNGKISLNILGKYVESEWRKTAQIRSNVGLDEFVIMPHHLHRIIIIQFNKERVGEATLKRQEGSDVQTKHTIQPNSLGSIIGQFKSVVSKQIRHMGYHDFKWQRNYYEHIIKNERELFNIRQYIRNNPMKWEINK